ncbi:hypothetical protein MUP77_04595 [Candidatus Bathyarchaeota archaeon]|nr:hypothetical protein [Candidatus Bathyarchaeota archaeon]
MTEELRCPALDEVLSGIEAGCRNDLAFRLAQYYSAPRSFLWKFYTGENILMTCGLQDDEVSCLIEHWNKKNNPPLSERELLICVKQGLKLPCSYGRFGQGMFAKYPLKKFCDKQKENCVVRKILKGCDAHESK